MLGVVFLSTWRQESGIRGLDVNLIQGSLRFSTGDRLFSSKSSWFWDISLVRRLSQREFKLAPIVPHMLLFNYQQAGLQLILLCPYMTSVDEMDLHSLKLASRCFNYNKGVEEIQDLQFKRKRGKKQTVRDGWIVKTGLLLWPLCRLFCSIAEPSFDLVLFCLLLNLEGWYIHWSPIFSCFWIRCGEIWVRFASVILSILLICPFD